MRDQHYYQRLKQIRQKYGYTDQNSPDIYPKSHSQWNNSNKQNNNPHKIINGYSNKQDHLFMNQKFDRYDKVSVLTHNQNIHNVQSKYSKSNAYNFQYQDKYMNSNINKNPSPSKRIDYNQNKKMLYPGQQMEKINLYQRNFMMNDNQMTTQPFNDPYLKKQKHIYSSPIKKLSVQQSERHYKPNIQDINNGSISNRYPIESNLNKKSNSYYGITPKNYQKSFDIQRKSSFQKDAAISQHNYRQYPQMISENSKNLKSVSPFKASSTTSAPISIMSHRQEGDDKISYKINNIDKIQSKIQSILNKNK